MASSILIIGSTGYAGKFLVRASRKLNHLTYAFVRKTAQEYSPEKKELIEDFKRLQVNIIEGDLYDHDSLVAVIEKVDVVISALGDDQILDQIHIINAIKKVKNVKRFFPSEFATDCDHVVDPVYPAKSIFANKATIRRTIEEAKIPYTYVIANCFAGRFLFNLCQPTRSSPPRDTVIIPGDGYHKAIFVKEDDFALCTIKAVEEPKTLNMTLYINPIDNTITFRDLVTLWENKINHYLLLDVWKKEDYLKKINESTYPLNLLLALRYSIFVSGDQTNFDMNKGVQSIDLFHDVSYTTVDSYLDQFT